MAAPSSSRNSKSPSRPSRSEIRVKTSRSASLPSRQALHFPQDSSLVNWMKNLDTSTMQVSSSMTIIPPDPIMEPTSLRLSKSTGRSIRLSGYTRPKVRRFARP